MRLFIAVDLADNMKKSLVGTLHELKKQGIAGSYVPMQNFHVTLAFLGEVKDPEEVMRVMNSLEAESSRMSFDGYGFFGDSFWIGIKTNQKLKKYAADLKKALTQAGLPCDMSKFEPHVTLIRKHKGPRPALTKVPSEDMMVKKISLMRSDFKDGKRVYKEICSVRAK